MGSGRRTCGPRCHAVGLTRVLLLLGVASTAVIILIGGSSAWASTATRTTTTTTPTTTTTTTMVKPTTTTTTVKPTTTTTTVKPTTTTTTVKPTTTTTTVKPTTTTTTVKPTTTTTTVKPATTTTTKPAAPVKSPSQTESPVAGGGSGVLHQMTLAPPSGQVVPLVVGTDGLPAAVEPPAGQASVLPSAAGHTTASAVPAGSITTTPVSIPDVPVPSPGLPADVGRGVVAAPLSHRPSTLGLLGGGVALLTSPIAPVTVGVAKGLRVPFVFASVLALFLVGQGLVRRRDPKLSRSPMRRDDDTLPFK
jgi:hypothetical protein